MFNVPESRASTRPTPISPSTPWSRIPTTLLSHRSPPDRSQIRLYSTTKTPPSLTHLTSTGTAHMVPLASPLPNTPNHKPLTHRTAIAISHVRFSNPQPAALILSSSLQKGDVLAVARIAGIAAAKKTSDLVPLCHNITVGGVEVRVDVVSGQDPAAAEGGREPADAPRPAAGALEDEPLPWDHCGEHGAVRIAARVQTFGQTGVEMEALTAVSVAALTVYDMCKAVDKGMRIEGTRVVVKEGGRSGDWREGARVGG